MESLEKVINIIVEQAGVNKNIITLESNLTEDLGCDELDMVEIVMALEENFGIEISDDTADKFFTVKDIVDYIDGSR